MAKYISINIVLELLCLLAAMAYVLKDKSLIWKSSIVFMLLTIVMEELGRHFNLTNQWKNNQLVYNLLTLPEAVFISSMFYCMLKDYIRSRPVVITGLALIYGLYLYEFIQNGPFLYMNMTITVMSVMFSVYSFLYLYLFIKNEAYVELKKHAAFWWVTGALMYYFGGLATNLLFTVMPFADVDINARLYSYVYVALNLFLYGFWSYSFKCRYQQTR
ncbi:hypothetical protein [Mucilaginibacter gilvus]|uniref:Uncharacterized protein n=1 Tax=Mucilaginibacter gilvus TaxID=2305909 RepID=A0A3S3UWV4_9SPHI|nr:hypothetical protein [Mucilaginibacter gilvus]RWY50084.1 hypothetical protein EPL05_15090 [Mucilaginibacter gilvus]